MFLDLLLLGVVGAVFVQFELFVRLNLGFQFTANSKSCHVIDFLIDIKPFFDIRSDYITLFKKCPIFSAGAISRCMFSHKFPVSNRITPITIVMTVT